MALYLYFDAALTNRVSVGTGLNPDEVMGSGTDGFTHDLPLWLANDTTAKRYEGVTVTAANDDAQVNFQYAPDVSGAPGTWADTLTIGAIAPGGSVKLWRRVTVAPGQPAHNRVNIKHRAQGAEYVV